MGVEVVVNYARELSRARENGARRGLLATVRVEEAALTQVFAATPFTCLGEPPPAGGLPGTGALE